MAKTEVTQDSDARAAAFHTTRWSVVVSAQGKSSRDAREPLEALCRQYWQPLYAYVRQRGNSAHDAQDLTQEFFARLLEKDWLHSADREKGRFRSFLLVALKRFLANEWDRAHTQIRGGSHQVFSLDVNDAEHRFGAMDVTSVSPEVLYERRWALALLESVMHRLRGEFERAGKVAEYEILKPSLMMVKGELRYDDVAAALGVAPASARSSVHRLRKRFRELFREEVAGTLAHSEDVDDEMRTVIGALKIGRT